MFRAIASTTKRCLSLQASTRTLRQRITQQPLYPALQFKSLLQTQQNLAWFTTGQKQLEIPEKISQFSDLLNSLSANPALVPQIVDTANQLINEEKIEECLELYQTALLALPNSASLNCRLGTIWLQLEETEKALPLIEKGLEFDPLEMGEGGLIGLASLYKFQNQEEKAISTYLKSIELNQLASYSHSFIALLYASRGDFDSAGKHQELSRAINPNDFASEWAYGELIFTKNQEQGIKILKNAATSLMLGKCENMFMSQEEVDELMISSNFRTGQILQYIVKDAEQAATYYTAVLTKDPSHVESHVQYASCLRKISPDNEKLAQEHLDKAKEIDPSKFETKLTEMWQK